MHPDTSRAGHRTTGGVEADTPEGQHADPATPLVPLCPHCTAQQHRQREEVVAWALTQPAHTTVMLELPDGRVAGYTSVEDLIDGAWLHYWAHALLQDWE